MRSARKSVMRGDFGINIFTRAERGRERKRKRQNIPSRDGQRGWSQNGSDDTAPLSCYARLSIRSSPADLHLRSLISASTRVSYYSLLTHSSRSWIIYHLDTPLDTAQCCSREMVASVRSEGLHDHVPSQVNKMKNTRRYIGRITK